MCKHKAQTNIDMYFEMKGNKYKNARTTSLRFLTTRTTSSAANDYAPSSSCADDDMLLVLMIAIATRTSMLVSAANQKRAATSSSLKIEEVEEGRSCQPGWLSVGIEPGACA